MVLTAKRLVVLTSAKKGAPLPPPARPRCCGAPRAYVAPSRRIAPVRVRVGRACAVKFLQPAVKASASQPVVLSVISRDNKDLDNAYFDDMLGRIAQSSAEVRCGRACAGGGCACLRVCVCICVSVCMCTCVCLLHVRMLRAYSVHVCGVCRYSSACVRVVAVLRGACPHVRSCAHIAIRRCDGGARRRAAHRGDAR